MLICKQKILFWKLLTCTNSAFSPGRKFLAHALWDIEICFEIGTKKVKCQTSKETKDEKRTFALYSIIYSTCLLTHTLCKHLGLENCRNTVNLHSLTKTFVCCYFFILFLSLLPSFGASGAFSVWNHGQNFKFK